MCSDISVTHSVGPQPGGYPFTGKSNTGKPAWGTSQAGLMSPIWYDGDSTKSAIGIAKITLKRKIRAPKAMSHSTLELGVPRMAYVSRLSKTCGRAKMSTQLCSHIMWRSSLADIYGVYPKNTLDDLPVRKPGIRGSFQSPVWLLRWSQQIWQVCYRAG